MCRAKHVLFIVPLFTQIVIAQEIGSNDILSRSELASISVLATKSGYSVKNGTRVTPVYSHNVQKELRKVPSCKLHKVLQSGPLAVSRDSDGQYSIKHHVRGPGGGPISGAVTYWGIKALAYGGIIGGATIAAAATGGAAAPILTAVGTGAMGATTGAAVVATAATVSAPVGAAATTLAGAAAASGSAATVIGAIEGTATTAGTAMLLCPWLP